MMKKKQDIRHRILIRFTEEEYALVKDNVTKCRLFTQNYFRMLIKGRRPIESPGDDYFELDHNFHKIMINLLQISGKAYMLNMKEYGLMWDVEQAFNRHCTRILKLMLRLNIT